MRMIVALLAIAESQIHLLCFGLRKGWVDAVLGASELSCVFSWGA
jgi:hypothetical protein